MRDPKPLTFRVLLCAATVLSLVACGGSDEVVVGCQNVPDLDSKCASGGEWKPEWKEAGTTLPTPPTDENLVPVDAVGGAPGYDYFVDRASISRGIDDVMRYTVVVRSPTGAVNVFHEGIRCATDQIRTYAYASSAGAFRPIDDPWGPLHGRGVRGYQDFLSQRIMCNLNGFAWEAEQAVAALRSQYTADGVRVERFCGDRMNCDRYGRRN